MKLQDNAMLSRLKISAWTGKKLDKKITKEIAEQHNTTEDAGKYTKALIAKEALEPITKAVSAARAFHYENTLPWLDDGARILPSANLQEFAAGLRKHKAEFERAVSEFIEDYERHLRDSRYRLNSLFNEDDYPKHDQLARLFKFENPIDPIPGPEDFRVQLAQDEVDAIRAGIEDRARIATEEGMKDVWRRVRDVVQAMTERLADPDKTFKNTLVGNIADLCDLLPRLNITNDAALETVRAELKSQLLKYSPETLRSSKLARKETYENADAILKRMAAYCES